MPCRTWWRWRCPFRPAGPSPGGCSTGTGSRSRPCSPCGGGSGSRSRWPAGSTFPMPVELQYDEFTEDILPNRLVKAAAHRLARTGLRSAGVRRDLGWVAGTLANVSLLEFPPARVPEVAFDRLNEHYRGVAALSRLILRHGAFEAGRGPVRASGFLMDMNTVFQEFLTQALREQLNASPQNAAVRPGTREADLGRKP